MKHRMKMKELEHATGVGRETIRYYIRQGLLPQPERSARNVAWYDGSFVERVALIKELQRKRFLPLHVIKAIVCNDEPLPRDEIQTLVELDGKLFPTVGGMPEVPPERLSNLASRTGLKASEVRELADIGLVEIETRDGDQWLEETSIRIAELWGKLRQAGFTDARGFPVSNMRLYVDFVRWLAREELRRFTRAVTGTIETAESARMAEDGIIYVNQILALMRKATLLRLVAEGDVTAAAEDTSAAPKAG